LIPHTLKKTTLGIKSIGDKVNIEFDIIGKYISKLIPKN
jgi:riboflavin synthase